MSLTEIRRRRVPEIMDSPSLDEAEHVRALAGLRRINRASGAAGAMAEPVLQLAKVAGLRKATLLDVACGGGDVPVALALAARSQGLELELTLLDKSALALQRAERAAREAELSCRTMCGDIAQGLPGHAFDFVTNSLFLHHLDEPEAVAALQAMRQAATRGVVVSDLRRCASGWIAAWLGCRLLSASAVVHFDGPASVRGAWTVPELSAMAAAAGMDQARVTRCRPWRMLLVWRADRRAS